MADFPAKRLLFIAPSPLGDAILTTGVLRHFIDRDNPDEVHVVSGSVSAAIFDGISDNITVVKKQKYSMHWPKLWRKLVTKRWYRVIDMRGSAMPYLLISKYRHRFVSSKQIMHKLKNIAKTFGLIAEDFVLGPWIKDHNVLEAAPYTKKQLICIAPFATWVGKEWPLDNFLQLAIRLTDLGAPFYGHDLLIMGAANELTRTEEFIKNWPADRAIHNVVGQISLSALFVILQNAKCAICNDSGLMHLSAASGVPTVGLFGPSPDELYAPWGKDCMVIRASESSDELIRKARAGVGGSLLSSITVDMAYEKIVSFHGVESS